MANKLTKKQEAFAQEYLETGNGVQSALKAYDTTDYGTAAMIASENLTKPKVKAYLESKADKAAEIIFELAQNSVHDNVRLGASKDILDRAGFKVAPDEPSPSTQGNTYNFLFSSETQEKVKQIEDAIKAQLTQRHDSPD